MATKQSTVEFIQDQLTSVENCSTRKMFGEYAVYCAGKVVALICDDTLFVKITDEGKTFVGKHYTEGAPYKGAKPAMQISEDCLDNRTWLSELIRITANHLPTPKPKASKKPAKDEISNYNAAQSKEEAAICDLLFQEIVRSLPEAERKIWHGSPVWFLEGNPIVGYGKLKDCIRLLFWSGQTFPKSGLHKEGSFKAAETRYTALEQVNKKDLARWLKDARTIQWDYKNIVKRKGVLLRLV